MKKPLWRKEDWAQDGGHGVPGASHDIGAMETPATAVIPDLGTNRGPQSKSS